MAMIRAFVALSLVALGVVSCLSTESKLPPRCNGKKNANPVNKLPPTLVKTVPNGKRFVAGLGNDTFHVAHLYGTPSEMGTAYGQLFKAELHQQIEYFDEYLAEEILKALPWLPPAIAEKIVQYGAGWLLEATFNVTRPFTPTKYIEELDAASDAAGLNKWKLRSINMFPEAIKAACTIVGANKAATANYQIAHLRGLDFGAHPKIKDHAMVTVYHPVDGSPAIANFGWLGLNGILTGMSNQTLGLGEKVWDKSYFWNGSLAGEAWTYVTRDALGALNLDGAISVIENANRTCGIHLGIGDSTTNEFRGIEDNARQVKIFNDSSITPYPQHPNFAGIVYWDKYAQPSHSYCLSDLLREYYGNITAEILATEVAPQEQTGDIHCAAFDYQAKAAYFANARKTWDKEGPMDAYDRQFTRLDMNALFGEPRP